MSLTLLSPPAAESIDLAEMKAHLRVTEAHEDALINGVLTAAVRAVEARGRLALMAQQWRVTFDESPEATVLLPVSPAVTIDAVSVIDAAGVPQAIQQQLYEFAPGSPGRLRRAGPWPVPGVGVDGVHIDFTAGYADAASVPEPLKQAVKMLAAYFFETRETAGEARVYAVPQAVDALIAPYRRVQL